MIYPRVNLLKKSEQRYEGAVSRSFILLCGVGAPGILVFMIVAFCFALNANIKSEIKSTQALWDNLEPRFKSCVKENQRLSTNHKILALFNGWQSSRASFVHLLDEVQDSVPGTIQFNRLSVRTGTAKAIYKTEAELQLEYSLIIEGVAHGSRAEKQVIELQKDLLSCEQIGNTFDSLKLDSMHKRTDSKGVNMREFRLVGEVEEGGKK